MLIGRSVWKPPSFTTLRLGRKTNHADQSSHSRVHFLPLGSVSKHNTVATAIQMENTANQVNCTDIHLFYSLPSVWFMYQTAYKALPLSFCLSKQQCKYATIIYLCHSCDSLSRDNPFTQLTRGSDTHTSEAPQVSEQIVLLKTHNQQAPTCNLVAGPRLSLLALSGFWNKKRSVLFSHTHTHTQLYKSCL